MSKSSFKNEGMFAGANPLMFENAKGLRKNMTHAEIILWQHLRTHFNDLKFRRQHVIGIYIADFYCHKTRLIIELDGSIHNLSSVKDYDKVRQTDLESLGYFVVRFTNKDVTNNIEAVLNKIKQSSDYLLNNINNSTCFIKK